MSRTRRLTVALAVALALVAALPAAAQVPSHCADATDAAVPFSVAVDGEDATGLVAYPAQQPQALVVFAHGYGHTSRSWSEHLRTTAMELGVVAVAMDYRGTTFDPAEEIPRSRGWRVAEGAADSIAAASALEAACGAFATTVLFGVSMGGNASGLAIAQGATRADGRPLFDWWFDLEGAVNVIETYLEARTLAPASASAAQAVADIEEEMGGSLTEVPEVYAERTVVNRVDDIAASGVGGVVLVHGVDDGLVPVNQSRELAARLAAVRMPYEHYTVGRRGDGESGTTVTGSAARAVDPTYQSPFAGHASERSTTHAVMRIGFARLRALLLDADVIDCTREVHMDGTEETASLTLGNCGSSSAPE